jgi:NAD(P)-dependent dehydrogenase (short-subunit alcohol dehydrogenase family)
MESLTDHTVVVAGGTANVGYFVARALLEREATVIVPSRSEERLDGLRDHLSKHVGETGLGRLHTFVGDLSDETEAAGLRWRIIEEVGTPDAVLASLGDFITTSSLLDASADDLRRALDGYLISNFMVARTFLPVLKNSGGTYVLVQGPLAFDLHPEFGADLISIATAAQHMLFRALAQELHESQARVVELVIHALIRDRRTQPSSPLPGEAVGAYAAYLLSGADKEVHGQSIDLRSLEQLSEVGLDVNNT